MDWEKWPRKDRMLLPKYVTPKLGGLFPLKKSSYDKINTLEGRRDIVKAIYNMLLEKNIYYALEEYQPSEKYQIIRSPKKIKEELKGTCLDLAALFCGLCLAHELLPMLIITRGHAFAAVSLTESIRDREQYKEEYTKLEQGPLEDIDLVHKLVSEGSWIAIECTGFAHSERLGQNAESRVQRTGARWGDGF